MFSYIINIHSSLRDWQMVESFFYHLQASGEFKMLSDISSITGVNDILAKKVGHYLEQHNIRDWQLVFIIDMVAPGHENRLTLGMQLQILKERLIKQLSNRGYPPAHSWVIAVDSDPFNDHGELDYMEGRMAWELDCFGYLGQAEGEESLYFNAAECSKLDQNWGDPVDLKQAGILQQPNPEFLMELQERSRRVINAADEIIENKINLYQDNNIKVNTEWDLISEDSFKIIGFEFKEALSKLLKPPLSNKLDSFLPSSIFKDILKKRLGLAGRVSGIRLLRIQVQLRPNHKKNQALIELAVLILFISSSINISKKSIQGRLMEGNIYKVEIEMDKSWQGYLNEYLLCLSEAERRMETKLMQADKVILPCFEEQGHYTSPLGKPLEEQPGKIFIKQTRNPGDITLWNNYLDEIAHKLNRKSEDILDSTWEDAQALNQTQKMGAPEQEMQISRLDDYQRKLDKQRANLKNRLSSGKIIMPDVEEEWTQYQKKLSGFSYRLDSRPTPRVMAVCMVISLLVILSAFAPLVYEMDWQSKWIELLYTLLLIGAGIVGVTLLAKKKVFHPIRDMVNKTRVKADELIRQQQELAIKCKDYLNQIFQMFRLNKTISSANEKLQALSCENLLLHYHRKQLSHQIDLMQSLLRGTYSEGQNLNFNTEFRTSDIKNLGLILEQKFVLNQDIYHSSLYSPLIMRMLLYPELNNQHIKVKIGGVEEDIQFKPFINEELHITFEKDQVYTI